MKAVIRLSYEMNEKVMRIFKSWSEEHDRYYGKPCGARIVEIPLSLRLFAARDNCYLGLDFNASESGIDDFRWLKSSGNWAGFRWNVSTGWELAIDSRRHGLPEGLSALFEGLKWVKADNGGRDLGFWITSSGLVAATLLAIETQADLKHDPLSPVPTE